MNLTDFLKNEIKRSENDLYTIYLYSDKGGWYRAYEWSAYLCEFFPNGLTEKERLTVNKKALDNNETFVFVGLRQEHFAKFLPNIDVKVEDGLMKIDVKSFFENNFNLENYQEKLNEWKSLFKIKEPKDKKNNKCTTYKCDDNVQQHLLLQNNGNYTMIDVVKEIMHHDTLNSTVLENMNFLFSLQKKVTNICI